MQAIIQNLIIQTRSSYLEETGQDLIEYALVVALIAFAAIAGMQTVAGDINAAFSNIGSLITQYTA